MVFPCNDDGVDGDVTPNLRQRPDATKQKMIPCPYYRHPLAITFLLSHCAAVAAATVKHSDDVAVDNVQDDSSQDDDDVMGGVACESVEAEDTCNVGQAVGFAQHDLHLEGGNRKRQVRRESADTVVPHALDGVHKVAVVGAARGAEMPLANMRQVANPKADEEGFGQAAFPFAASFAPAATRPGSTSKSG